VTRTLFGGLGAAAMLLVASCSASTTNYKDAATKIIEGQLQDELAMGELTASCEEPTSKDVGTTFACTADTPHGDTITLTAEIQNDEKDGKRKKVFVHTTNVLTAENLTEIEGEAARILSEKVGQDVPAEAIDCGQQAIVAAAGEPFMCSLSDPSNPTVVYDTSITLDDLTKPTHLDIEVASSPRA
jgi:hypothetical protein